MSGVYDQEADNCLTCGQDPCVCEEISDRFMALMDKIKRVPGIDPESVRMAYVGFEQACTPDIEAEFGAWLDTTDGKFAQYRAEHGCR